MEGKQNLSSQGEATDGLQAREIDCPSTPVKWCDGLMEGLLYFMVVFAPWAFGTTERWSITVMNAAGYLLGGVWVVKAFLRRKFSRLGVGQSVTGGRGPRQNRLTAPMLLPRILGGLTVLLLVYCAVSALNARATFNEREGTFAFRPFRGTGEPRVAGQGACLKWLPHSYDQVATWQAFRNYLALALVFWAGRDWLLNQSPGKAQRDDSIRSQWPIFPRRLHRLLWVLALNGTLLGMEGILQRFEGSGKLLWLVRPYINSTAESQFGPYAYRSNAAQYFNLVWPVCVGFWWALHRTDAGHSSRSVRFFRGARTVLLPGAIVMAACPIISTSRGGALVALIETGMVAAVLFFAYRRSGWRTKVNIALALSCVLVVAGYWGWQPLRTRLMTMSSDDPTGRAQIFENALRMATDFPAFGSGPGTFGSIYHLYRKSQEQEWAAYAHNDWPETRVTFGWIGSGLIALALLLVLARWFFPGGIEVSWRLAIFFWISLSGCLLHGLVDFPLQVYSILFLFVLFCAMLFSLSRKRLANTVRQ